MGVGVDSGVGGGVEVRVGFRCTSGKAVPISQTAGSPNPERHCRDDILAFEEPVLAPRGEGNEIRCLARFWARRDES